MKTAREWQAEKDRAARLRLAEQGLSLPSDPELLRKRREYMREYRRKNREKINEQRRARYAELKATDPEGFQERRQRRTQQMNDWYATFKENDPEGHRQWLDAVNERRRQHARR